MEAQACPPQGIEEAGPELEAHGENEPHQAELPQKLRNRRLQTES
jgi:hypothetical protein